MNISVNKVSVKTSITGLLKNYQRNCSKILTMYFTSIKFGFNKLESTWKIEVISQKSLILGHFVQCDWFYMVPFDRMLIYCLKMWFLCYAETFKNAL